MADTKETKTRKFLDVVMKRLKRCVDAEEHNRNAAIDDLKFLNGEQWDDNEKKRRNVSGRPALQINLLPKFVDQVTGEMRYSRPAIKFRPVDTRADINMAKIREGIVRNIEYLSNAPAIYDHAAEMQVSCGYGAWRVLTRYTEENPFIQEIYLESLPNPFMAYLDPDCKDFVGSDAKFGFVLQKMRRSDYEDKYPDSPFPSDNIKFGKGLANELWYDKDTITVAEYYVKETEKITMHQLEDGSVVDDIEYKEMIRIWEEQEQNSIMKIMKGAQSTPAGMQPPQTPSMGAIPPSLGMKPIGMKPQQGAPMPPAMQPPGGAVPQPSTPPVNSQMLEQMDKPTLSKPKPKIVKTRGTDRTYLKQYIVTCNDILDGGLDGNRVAGKFIPLVFAYGKVRNIEGKKYVRGLIRDGKDSQKLVNYWNTTAAETIALAPKTPWVGTSKQFEGYEKDFAAANTENFPFLKYNPDPDAPGPPQRTSPGQPPVAVFEQIRRGEENLRSVIGMIGSEMNAEGPERTGVAVSNKNKPSEITTFVFLVNLGRAVAYTGQIINEMIPEIYDTERDVRLRNIDDTETFVPVNTTVSDALKKFEESPERYVGFDKKRLISAAKKYGKDAKFNELTAGKYDVVVTTGPSYHTQRQESAETLIRLTSTMPEQMKLASDIIVRNLDFKDSEEMAERFRKSLPPNLVKLREGEEPAPQAPPPPQVQLAQAKVQSEQIKNESLKMKMEIEKIKLQKEIADAGKQPQGVDPAEAEIAKMEMVQKKMQIDLENQKRDYEVQIAAIRAQQERERAEFEIEKQRLAIQFQREAHNLKMQEVVAKMEADKEVASVKKDPLKLRK